jgi:hypothetical protein
VKREREKERKPIRREESGSKVEGHKSSRGAYNTSFNSPPELVSSVHNFGSVRENKQQHSHT